MIPDEPMSTLGERMEAATVRVRRREARLARHTGSAPRAGFVYAFPAPVPAELDPLLSWCLVLSNNDGSFLAVPCDQASYDGPADILIDDPEDDGIPYTLRCATHVTLTLDDFRHGWLVNVLSYELVAPASERIARTQEDLGPYALEYQQATEYLQEWLSVRRQSHAWEVVPSELFTDFAENGSTEAFRVAAASDGPAAELAHAISQPPSSARTQGAVLSAGLPGRLLAIVENAAIRLTYTPAQGESPPPLASTIPGRWNSAPDEHSYFWSPAIPASNGVAEVSLAPNGPFFRVRIS